MIHVAVSVIRRPGILVVSSLVLPLFLSGCVSEVTDDNQAGSDSVTASESSTRTTGARVSKTAFTNVIRHDGNPAPVIEPVGAQNTPAGNTLSFDITASDPDGSIPVLSCVNCPPGASLYPSASGGIFTWQAPPDFRTREPIRVVIRATDANDPTLTSERAVYITVADKAPQLDTIGDATVTEGETLKLPVALKTADPNPARLSVIIFEAPLTDSLTANGADFTFSRASAATYRDGTGRIIHVPVDTPRFLDKRQGLLIEGRRTNLVAPSINPGSSPWTGEFGGTAIDRYGTAPDGSITSSLVRGSTSAKARRKVAVGLIPLDHYETPAGYYALKLHIKAGNSELSRIGIYNDSRAEWESFVEISWNGGMPSVSGSMNTTRDSLTERGRIRLDDTGYKGWWILSYSFEKKPSTTPDDFTSFQVEPDLNGTTKYIEVWGAQLEPGHLSTSYIHNITTTPKVREADLLTYDISGPAPAFPGNNVMIESEYYPRWRYDEVRGWHPRLWGSAVDDSTYFLARTSRSSPNFVATRTFDKNALREDVTLGPAFDRGDLVRVVTKVTQEFGLEILPDFMENRICGTGPLDLNCQVNRTDQPWGDRFMVGNLTGLSVSNMSDRETDGPLNASIRHVRVHVLDAATPNLHGVSLVNGVFHWTPEKGSSTRSPYLITVRATNPENPEVYVQQDVKLTVVPPP